MPSPLLFTLILSFCIPLSLSDPRATQAALVCTNTTASPLDRQPFVDNFLAAVDAVTTLVSAQSYGGAVNGSGNTTVYAFGECMRDLSRSDCDLCFAQIKTQILRCLPFQRLVRGGRLFYDGCYLRYDEYNFFNESLSDVDQTVCGSGDFGGDKALFGENVMKLVRNLSDQGVKNDGFFVGSLNRRNLSVYGLAQCWEFVNESDCKVCLADSVSRIQSCVPKEEGRVLNTGCYMRYSTHKFYNNHTVTDEATTGNGDRRRLAVILAAISGSVAFVLLVAAISFFMRKKHVKKKREVSTAEIYRKKQRSAARVASKDAPTAVSVIRWLTQPCSYGVASSSSINCRRLHPDVGTVRSYCSELAEQRHLGCNKGLSLDGLDPLWNGKIMRSGRFNPRREDFKKRRRIDYFKSVYFVCKPRPNSARPCRMVVKMLKGNHEISQPTQPPFINSGSAEISQKTGTSQPRPESYTLSSGNSITENFIEPR
ncbi:cysteine-rich RLK (RECEPTOR-like protein kinase) 3 [Actinidia rufa]|uniref:Cysteine-rich RLK (RECEPTOR-like protein kinase) 3 n=1 Tax=Actinidia rufa TaxID=165716 RepID=A0A7J0HDT9_9ERIC|nr:cysteine-rich RLK (RECEPTOR-like protein kinase) 3 [Actinidia rufa]